MDDIFEKIINGEVPSEKIYEDAHTLAFLDINPVSPGHTLVVTKKRYRNLLETPEDELPNLMATIKKVSEVLLSALGAGGVNVIFNNEKAAGQVVFHTHAHVIPRFEGDGHFLWKHEAYKEGEMKKTGEKMRAALK